MAVPIVVSSMVEGSVASSKIVVRALRVAPISARPMVGESDATGEEREIVRNSREGRADYVLLIAAWFKSRG